jgi:hypothetical protein
MRAYLIDAEQRTINEIGFSGGGLEEIYQLLGCSRFASGAQLNGSIEEGFDTVLVSDDDMEDRDDPRHWFQIDADQDPPPSYPLAGRGLVVGIDQEGEGSDALIGRDELVRRVIFTKRKFRGFKVTPGGRTFEVGGVQFRNLIEVELLAPIVEEGP